MLSPHAGQGLAMLAVAATVLAGTGMAAAATGAAGGHSTGAVTQARGAPAGAAGPATAAQGRSFGDPSGMRVVVAGTPQTGLKAEVYDGKTFVTSRGMTQPYDLTVLPGTSSQQPTGPNLLPSSLSWQGPVGISAGAGNGGTLTNGTAPGGQSGVNWVQPSAPAQTWIYLQPAAELTAGDQYQYAVTLQGSGDIFLDFYNGQVDLQSKPVQLSATPVTLTVTGLVPSASGNTPLQVRTATAGAVDLWATGAAIQATQPTPVTSANQLRNSYPKYTYDASTKTLTLSGAASTVGNATVTRTESYRFVNATTIDAHLGISTNQPVVAWYTPYTDFNPAFTPMWVGGASSNYTSPNSTPQGALSDSPIPALGVSGGSRTYGVASYSTWDDPIPGYDVPHLVVNGNSLAAPLIGTQTAPVVLSAGQSRSWGQVLFRGGQGTYGLALGAELATGEALGLGTPTAGSCGTTTAEAEFCLVARVTAYWDREGTSSGGNSLVPSMYYGPSTYMRDSFWTSLALTGTPYEDATETAIISNFTSGIPTSGSDAGHVPVTAGGAEFPDESGLYYLIRMERDVDSLHLPVGNNAVATQVLSYIQANQVKNGAFLTAAPANYGNGFTISPDSWLDGYLFPAGAVNAYDQGLYVVALEAARKLGLNVTSAQVTQAEKVYQGLYDPKLGYLVWLSGTTYKSPDVLAGDALSVYLYDQPLLPAADVAATLRAQAVTKYGMKALATQQGGYVPASQFLTLQTNAQGQVNGDQEPAGWYQNGGSWFLWTYLAEYAAARSGDTAAAAAIARSVAQQLEVTPMSKEFQLTAKNPADSSDDPSYPYPLGSSGLVRQGFGWNSAYAALESSLAGAPSLRPPLR